MLNARQPSCEATIANVVQLVLGDLTVVFDARNNWNNGGENGQRSKYRNVPLFTVNDKNTEFDQYLEKRLTNRNSLFYSRITN